MKNKDDSHIYRYELVHWEAVFGGAYERFGGIYDGKQGNYKKSLPLHDAFLTREASPVSDDEPQIVNSYFF